MALPLTATRTGAGPLLVCHPGGPGMHPDYLGPLTGPLAEDYTVALIHPRGTGGSARPADQGSYSPEEYADDLAFWIENAAGSRPIHLLGHSHGGLIAALVAARRPDLVDRLILLGTPAYGGDEAEQEAEEFQQARLAEPAVAEAAAILAAQGDDYPADDAALGRLIAEVIPLWVGPMSEAAREWRAWLTGQSANTDALRYFNENVFPALADFMAPVREVACPVLAVSGELDGWAGPRHLDLLAEAVPRCTTVLVKGSGHMCHVDATGSVVTAIQAFLTEDR